MVLSEGMNPLGLTAPDRFVIYADEGGEVVGAGQLKPCGDEAKSLELASVVVSRERRGRGIGTSIVQRLLGDVPAGARVFALTLAGSAGWYMERFGFETVARGSDAVPLALRAEAAIGAVVARAVADDELVVLRWEAT